MLPNIFLGCYIIIILGKIIISFYNILYVKNVLNSKKEPLKLPNKSKIKNILILIPALREQVTIQKTLDHFKNLQISIINMHVAIVGTIRENQVENKPSTKTIVLEWIDKYTSSLLYRENLEYHFFEANDPKGDRATQLNFAADKFEATTGIKLDIIGVYDADSLPSTNTLISVIDSYEQNENLVACQQPVHFIDASNEMANNKTNPILVANALYQSTWTVIRELPRWQQYYTHCLNSKNIYRRNVYLIGHGEFLTYKDYIKFRFPENEVTDGIQLGYRLAMAKKSIKPPLEFCSDDAPKELKQLIQQHKRWFGGCMRLKAAYLWSKKNFGTAAIFQLLDGLWSQFSWAWASLLGITALIIGLFSNLKLAGILALLMFIYCYIIPIIAHQFLPKKIKVRLIDWLCLPLAIAIKGIGPNMYFVENIIFSKLFQKPAVYQKVERKSE